MSCIFIATAIHIYKKKRERKETTLNLIAQRQTMLLFHSEVLCTDIPILIFLNKIGTLLICYFVAISPQLGRYHKCFPHIIKYFNFCVTLSFVERICHSLFNQSFIEGNFLTFILMMYLLLTYICK